MTPHRAPEVPALMREAAEIIRNEWADENNKHPIADRLDAAAATLEAAADVPVAEVVQALREAVETEGRQYSPAVQCEIWASKRYIYPGDALMVLRGVKEPTAEICASLGYRRRVVYERIEG
jgi:hypothetical protein